MFRLKHELSDKEKAIGMAAIIVLIITLYYFAIYRPCTSIMTKYDTTQISDEMVVEQAKLAASKNMQSEINANYKAGVGRVYPYNNLHNEVNALNNILSKVDSFDMDFDSPVRSDMTVRRNVNISFMTKNYEEAKEILKKLYRCRYRCLLRNISLQMEEEGCSVSVQITFIETMENATTEEGLTESTDTTVGTV